MRKNLYRAHTVETAHMMKWFRQYSNDYYRRGHSRARCRANHQNSARMLEIKEQERVDGANASGALYVQVQRKGFGEYEMIDFVNDTCGSNCRPVF